MIKKEKLEIKNIKKSSITNSKFLRFVIGGVIATLAFNVVMYGDIAITGIPLDIPTTLGNLIVGEHESAQLVGNVIHFLNGIGLALLFGYVAIPISKRIVHLPIIVYSLAFVIIELIVAVWFGMLPALGAGIAGLNIAPEVPIMTLIRHVIFGIVLGLVVRSKVK